MYLYCKLNSFESVDRESCVFVFNFNCTWILTLAYISIRLISVNRLSLQTCKMSKQYNTIQTKVFNCWPCIITFARINTRQRHMCFSILPPCWLKKNYIFFTTQVQLKQRLKHSTIGRSRRTKQRLTIKTTRKMKWTSNKWYH